MIIFFLLAVLLQINESLTCKVAVQRAMLSVYPFVSALGENVENFLSSVKIKYLSPYELHEYLCLHYLFRFSGFLSM